MREHSLQTGSGGLDASVGKERRRRGYRGAAGAGESMGARDDWEASRGCGVAVAE